jgi:orotate phosphoribosyltransferase
MDKVPENDLIALLGARRGHFRLESGHHGDLWLDLELLCFSPRLVLPFANALADRISVYHPDVICGALVEGAFVALMVANALGVEFCYAAPLEPARDDGALFGVQYRIPGALRSRIAGKRVAIVNDVINAGSAVRGAMADIEACGAVTVAVGTLVVLGDSFLEFATARDVALQPIVKLPNVIWSPDQCPLCRTHAPLTPA